jgi:hypothetical protein
MHKLVETATRPRHKKIQPARTVFSFEDYFIFFPAAGFFEVFFAGTFFFDVAMKIVITCNASPFVG